MSIKYKAGDRVILTGKTLIPYPDWPVWGSKYSCVGTVADIKRELVHVIWDNDHRKIILPSSLSHFTGREDKSLSPNIAFMLYKRNKHEKGR
jgi:hypothetical protein